jgi:hypothetical protein
MRHRGAWILTTWLGMSPVVNADNKLFITDVLDPGQMETQETLRFTKSSQVDFTFPSGTTGTGSRSTTRFSASFGVGVIEGFQIDALIPYAITDKESDTFNGVTRETDRSGIGDPTLGFKFRLAGAEKGPWVGTARLDIKPQAADSSKQGTGATSYTLELAGSVRVGESLRPYADYDGTFRTNDQGDTHTLRLGAEKIFGEALTATLEGSASRTTTSKTDTGFSRYTISLSAYFQTARNLYLIPELDYSWRGAITGINGFSSAGKDTVSAASIALYYLF